MKSFNKIFISSFTIMCLTLAWTGCVGVGVSGEVGYGGGPWFHDDGWLDGGGRGWYGGHGGGAYVHPSGGGHGGGHEGNHR
jgi:hypothetical protein